MNNSALQKLAHRAGANRISSDVYENARTIGTKYLNFIVEYAIIYCEHEKKKVVSETHAINAINNVGFAKMYPISGSNLKRCPTSTKKKTYSPCSRISTSIRLYNIAIS
jgi:histone H3/H4